MGNKHFGNAIKHNGLLISKCDDSQCDIEHKNIKTHRHCPHCGYLYSKRNEFINHLDRCYLSLANNKDSKTLDTTNDNYQVQQIINQMQQDPKVNTQQTYVYLITNDNQASLTNDNSSITIVPSTTSPQLLQQQHHQIINLNKRKLDSSSNVEHTKLSKQQLDIDLSSNSSNHTIFSSNDLLTNDNLHTQPSTSNNNNSLSTHITQNYSILAQEIQAPLENDIELKSWNPKPVAYKLNKTSNSNRAQKDIATCQFCGRAMLKKNIPTHIRRAHTPKEELVCLNEEQNIFTFQHLKPGQRRKRSARAYDYSLMTATVSIDDDPTEGIENKFITEGEEILSTDLLQLADRIKFGITQIPLSTLTKLIDILTKIEFSTTDEVNANAKTIKNMILLYLTSGEEFKYKIKQVGDDIIDKKKQVQQLRADLKEVMTRKAQLERRIQPLVCELQKLEDQHGNLIDTILQLNGLLHIELANTSNNSNDDDSTTINATNNNNTSNNSTHNNTNDVC
jgi:archaellum component FlaG (FlaF/FlaG flagellin family)